MKLAVLAALEQRVALRYTMPPMTSQETTSYISHHLKLAGRAGWGAPNLPDCGPPVRSIRKGLGVNGRQEKELHA